MLESGSNSGTVWLNWVWYIIFWISIIALSLLGLKWLLQGLDEKGKHKFVDDSFFKDFINKDKKYTADKDEDN